jgi:hypothetical protein
MNVELYGLLEELDERGVTTGAIGAIVLITI